MKTRISILITTAVCNIVYATSVVLETSSSTDTYLGCYEEYTTESVFVIPTSNIFRSVTPDGCKEGCRKDDIYSFAGIWGGTECYCASGLNEERIRRVNNSFCYTPCPAEPAEFCGGPKDSYTFSVHSVCSRGFYGSNCTDKCNCKDNKDCTVHGVCPGDECAAGWKLNSSIPNRERCSIDVDECQTKCRSNSIDPINCHTCSSALHQQCKNTQGSFTCACENGYRKTSMGTCAEIISEHSPKLDECSMNGRSCEHACVNMDGSYYCVCKPGYRLHFDGYSCVDVDECQTPCSSLTTTECHQCKQSYECQNTIGSFRCSCKSGFIFDSQHNTCADIDECSEKQVANCSHTCMNTNGSYECGCLEGFKLEDDGHHCVVVESGLWSLVVGLVLGNGFQAIVIMALAITVCTLFARRNRKAPENEVDEKSCAKVYNSNVYAQLDSPQANGCRSHPLLDHYDHLDKPRANGSRPLPATEYDKLGHVNAAAGFAPTEFCNAVDHQKENQEDPYLEIA